VYKPTPPTAPRAPAGMLPAALNHTRTSATATSGPIQLVPGAETVSHCPVCYDVLVTGTTGSDQQLQGHVTISTGNDVTRRWPKEDAVGHSVEAP